MPKKLNDFKPFLEDYVNRVTKKSPDGQKNKYVCPICASGTGTNKTGAFSITDDGLLWHCFKCDKGGDLADLVKELNPELITPRQTLDYLVNLYGNDNKPLKKKTSATKSTTLTREKRIKIWETYKEELDKHPDALAYLKGRGLTDETIKTAGIGYNPERDSIIIPYDQDFSYYADRKIKTKDFRKPPRADYGEEPLFNREALSYGKPVYITESQICALSIRQEMKGEADAVALGGIGFDKLKPVMESGTVTAPVIVICLDNDETGRAKAEELELYLKGLDPSIYAGKVIKAEYLDENNAPLPQKDPNDLLQANKDVFKAFLRRPLSEYAEKVKKAKEREIEAINLHRAVNLWDKFKNEDYEHVKIVKTNWGKLDDYLGGGLFPNLYILGGLSSTGKTTFLLQLADKIAETNVIREDDADEELRETHILYFTLEQSPAELISKSIARMIYEADSNGKERTITSQHVLIKELNEKLDPKRRSIIDIVYNSAYRKIGKYIYFYEAYPDRIGVDDIAQEVKRHYNATGIYPLVFIDYLQILRPQDDVKHSGDKEITDRNISELKKLSALYNIPVVCLSSFNRPSYNKPAGMESFKESGSIEYGADVLLALEPSGVFTGNGKYAEQENQKNLATYRTSTGEKTLKLKILKRRGGPLSLNGKVLYPTFYPKHSYFNLDYIGNDEN